MKKNKNIIFSIMIALGAISFSAFIASAQTVTPANVGYPIAALGNCKDQADCKAFCAKGENMPSCVTFAEQKGMLSGEDLRISKIVAEKVSKKETPGGCQTKAECESFCQGKVENINKCISFGEELGVIPKADLAEAKKISEALSKGAKMPGSCKSKTECESFCSVGSHIDECLNFAEASGILPADQLAEARKVAPFLKNGETPGKCTTKDSCDSYCKDDTHFEECLGFAEKAGFISSEDATMAKKVGGKGPGGCKGKEECMTYCNQDANATECANFAKDKGLLTKEQEADINTGVDRMRAGLDQIPAEAKTEVIACLENSIGKEKFDRIMAKLDLPTQAIGGKIEACFGKVEEIMKAKMMPAGGIPTGASGGTGSAPTKEELMKNIPDSVPPEMRANIEKQIESQIPLGAPTGAPTGGPVPAPTAGTSGMPTVDCSRFNSMLSAQYCSAVPESVRDICIKCKS